MKAKILERLYQFCVRLLNLINYNKPKILLYTDSRGYDVIGKSGKNPFTSYSKKLLFNFRVDYFICKEKHTTISDFLVEIKKVNIQNYDYVIMHCGVVDFSPRPISNLDWVLNSKKNNEYFSIALSRYNDYYKSVSDVLYKGEQTNNLYSPNFLKEVLLPELKEIKNLIWINSNHFVKNWDGNFDKGRPENIDEMVSNFDDLLKDNITNVVNLKNWTNDEIKRYTIDNIHFTKEGFEELSRLIKNKIYSIQ